MPVIKALAELFISLHKINPALLNKRTVSFNNPEMAKHVTASDKELVLTY